MNKFKELAMGKTMKVVVGIAALAVLAGLPAEAQTSNTSTQVHQPITQNIPDLCINPNPTYDLNNVCVSGTFGCITLSGEYFYEYHSEQQPNGDTHLHWTSHYNLKGTEAGINYVSTDQQTYDLKMDPDGSFPPSPTSDFHTSDKFKLIAQGPYPKETIQSFLHVKVNAKGVSVTQEKDPVVKCQGPK